ncbi:MAG: SDR family oxidoreductase [Nannocystaceae bacterium]
MRVFVTGATGFIGSAVVQELIGAGHEVIGLARSDGAARALEGAGAGVHRGDLEDLEGLGRGAAAADAVIHTGFIHDFTRFREVCEADRRAIEALGAALVGGDRPLLVCSGTGLLTRGALATEDQVHAIGSDAFPRVMTEEAVDALVARGVRVGTVRLPQVHGEGDRGFVPMLIDIARARGVSAYVGDGANRWPSAHRLDVARLFRLALVSPFAAGARFHAVAEDGVRVRDIAGSIGRHLGIPVVTRSAEEAPEHFGWFANFAAMDGPASSERTRRALGWEPVEIGLMEDLERGHYFTSRGA